MQSVPPPSLPTRRLFLENSASLPERSLVPQKSKAQPSANPATSKGATRSSGQTQREPILRYHVPWGAREEYLAELTTTFERTGITDLALFTI